MNMRETHCVSESHAQLEAHREEPVSARDVLQELYILLEEYAPTWYTQEHHDRALQALLSRDS